jgi:hypothetical protein
MDGRQDQVILIQQRHAGLIARGVRWVERQFGEKAFAGGIAAGDLLKLDQIGAPCLGVFMNSIKVRFIPQPRAFEICWPFRVAQVADGLDEGPPVIAGAWRCGKPTSAPRSSGIFREAGRVLF